MKNKRIKRSITAGMIISLALTGCGKKEIKENVEVKNAQTSETPETTEIPQASEQPLETEQTYQKVVTYAKEYIENLNYSDSKVFVPIDKAKETQLDILEAAQATKIYYQRNKETADLNVDKINFNTVKNLKHSKKTHYKLLLNSYLLYDKVMSAIYVIIQSNR